MDFETRARLARDFMENLPHVRDLGMVLEDLGPGWAVMGLDYDPRLIGDPETGVLHGGVVTALLDTCCGTAVMMHPEAPLATATMDLRIDYMRPAPAGQRLRARAECFRMTRSVAFVRATAHADDPAREVAAATAAFTAERGAS